MEYYNLDYPCGRALQPMRLFAKQQYNEKVKTSDYTVNLENKPFDNDIRHPKLNLSLAHYQRWGYGLDLQPWTTTTADMLAEPFKHMEIKNPNKKFLSFYTYHDERDCKQEPSYGKYGYPTHLTINDYVTTMQNSYKPINTYLAESMRETKKCCRGKSPQQKFSKCCFLENRRIRVETPSESRNKFWDDDNLEEIKLLQECKPNRLLSFNFMTGCQSDGTPIPKDRSCIL